MNKLTKEDLANINIAVALALGWKREKRRLYGGEKNVWGWGINQHLDRGDKDRDFVHYPFLFPPWATDLNTMREAEKTLTEAECEKYWNELCDCELAGSQPGDEPASNHAFHLPAAAKACAFARIRGFDAFNLPAAGKLPSRPARAEKA